MALSETALATAAVTIIRSVMGSVASGASEQVGAKIIDLLQSKLQIILKPEQVKQQQKQLEGAISAKAIVDGTFKSELESLVNEFEKTVNSNPYYQQENIQINQQDISGPAIGINNNVGSQFFRS
jgi:hypothetical protein